MGLFTRTQKEEPAAESPAPEKAEVSPLYLSLCEKFRYARFGTECRTLAFVHPDVPDEAEYLKALEDPLDRSWYVFNVREKGTFFHSGNTEPSRATQIKNAGKGLTMMEMVRELAEFEGGQRKMGFDVRSDNSAELGTGYFRTFAEREGLVFELTTMEPHPTLNGAIATPGHFAPDAEEKARKSFESLVHPDAKQFSLSLNFDEKAHENILNALVNSYNKIDKYKLFLEDLNSLRAIMVDYFGKSYKHRELQREEMAKLFKMDLNDFIVCQRDFEAVRETDAKKPLPYGVPEDLRNINYFSSFCFQWLAHRAMKKLGEVVHEDPNFGSLVPQMKRLSMYMEAFRANAYMRLIYEDHPQTADITELYRDAISCMEKLAAAAGVTQPEVYGLKGATMSRKPLKEPADMTAFIDACRNAPALFAQQIEEYKNRLGGKIAPPKP